MKLIKRNLFLLLLAAVPVVMLFCADLTGGRLSLASLADGSFAGELEYAVQEAFPLRRDLEQMGVDIRLLSGQREQKRIFISAEALMRNIDEPNEPVMQENISAIQEFAGRLDASSSGKKRLTFALIPTSGAVLQQNLPRYAGSHMVNQNRLIEEIYNQVSADVRVVDVYSALLTRQDQYIYYRTENNLSSLGGYYVYSAVGSRLGILNRSLSQFDISYVSGDYLGDLYNQSPYKNIQPDILSVYQYNRSPFDYTVTHQTAGERKVYHTLYPQHHLDLDSSLGVYMGGLSAVTDIQVSSPYKTRLLVFGDKTALAYVPFLVNHYQQVTVVNLLQMDAADFDLIQPEIYDQVLFCYSVENFVHTRGASQAYKVQWNEDR